MAFFVWHGYPPVFMVYLSPKLAECVPRVTDPNRSKSFRGKKRHGESGVFGGLQKNYALTMSDLPYLLIGFLFIGFIILITKTFFDGVKRDDELRKKRASVYRRRRSWWSDDH